MQIEVTYSDPVKKETFKVKGNKIVFGRSLNANVTIKREEMSRFHFQIDAEGTEYFITDLKSSNGVFVNGEKIPSEVRLPYNNLFPIEIAHQISIIIRQDKEEEESYIPFTLPVNEEETPLSVSAKENLTTTMVLDKSPRTRPERSIPRQDSEKKSSLSPQLLLPIFIILAVPIYLLYWNRSESVEGVTEVQDIEMESRPEDIQAPAVIPKMTESDIPYKSLMQNSECSQYSEICQQLSLLNPKEGIVFHNEMILIFVNLEFIPNEDIHPNFKDLSQKDKAEFFMARAGTHDALLSLLSTKAPSHLIVIGFTSIDKEVFLKYRLNLSYKQIPPLDQGIHTFLFHEIFYKGDFNLYRQYVGYYAEMSEL